MSETDRNPEKTEGTEKPRSALDRREIRFFILMTMLCLIGLAVLFFGHPTGYSFIPRCPFYQVTGLYCPGCGSLRATHYLLQGEVTSSFRNHPLLIPLLAFLLFLYGKRLYEFRFNTSISLRGELLFSIAVLMTFVLFFVIRNIPTESLEWTRPPEPVFETIR